MEKIRSKLFSVRTVVLPIKSTTDGDQLGELNEKKVQQKARKLNGQLQLKRSCDFCQIFFQSAVIVRHYVI